MSPCSAPRPVEADPAAVFAALGDPTRLSLVQRLGDGQARSLAELSATTRLTRQAVTKHLRVLERAGLVRNLGAGRKTGFVGRPEAIADAQAYLDAVAARWDDALARLRRHVERSDPL